MSRNSSDASNLKARNYVYKYSQATGNDLLALMALADYANAERQCWPQHDTVACHAGLSKSTVKRSYNALVELGELQIKNRSYPNGDPMSNLYTLLILPEGYKGHEEDVRPSALKPLVPVVDRFDLEFARRIAQDPEESALRTSLSSYQAFWDESGYRVAHDAILKRVAQEQAANQTLSAKLAAGARAAGVVPEGWVQSDL